MSAKLMKPNVSLRPKNLQLALIAHLLSLLGSLIWVIFGLIDLFGAHWQGLFGILFGALIFVVEFDLYYIDAFKDPLTRGIVWLVLSFFGFGITSLSFWILVVAGILYIIYSQ